MKPKILVVDNQTLFLFGTLHFLQIHYPDAEIYKATTAVKAIKKIQSEQFDLAIIDISIPEKGGMRSEVDTGIELLKELMRNYPLLNIMVQSIHTKSLVRLKNEIDNHEGGFTVADKALPEDEILARVDWALKGLTHTKDLGRVIDIKPQWLELLRLAFEEGIKDKEIAQRMNISERSVRHYWTKIQDVLDIYPETDIKKDKRNYRIQALIRAREEGLID